MRPLLRINSGGLCLSVFCLKQKVFSYNMTRLLYICAAALVLIGIVACGDPTITATAKPEATSTTAPTIAATVKPEASPTPTTVSPTFGSIFNTPTAARATPPTVKPVALSNCARSQEATSQKLVYAAIGASDTVGTGASDPVTQGWVRVLCDKMPAGTQMARLGIGGATVKVALTTEVPQAVAAKPDIITIWNAVNDIIQGMGDNDYRATLNAMLDRLTAETRAPILIGNVPDITNLPLIKRFGISTAQVADKTARWNTIIADAVAAHKGRVYLVDLYAGTFNAGAHPEWVSGDGFHPNSAGYVQLANAYWQTLQQNKLLS